MTAGKTAIVATIISIVPAHTKTKLKAMMLRKGNEYKATPIDCVRAVIFTAMPFGR